MSRIFRWTLMVFAFLLLSQHKGIAQNRLESPGETSNTSKPWTRWWWMGNAVDKAGIEQNLITFQKAGLGGVEITPIYGVKGEEPNYISYLSPQWIAMLNYTIVTADSLGLQVDMTLGTGWPYGGSQVNQAFAATKLIVDQTRIERGEKVNQQMVVEEESDKESASLKHILAFGDDGSYLDLTDRLEGNLLKWKAKGTNYTLYKVFVGKTGQQVKRAAPGGEGYTLDHYSKDAFAQYVSPFDSAFAKVAKRPRAIFNDSYEVYGTDFTPDFFDAFKSKRGYDLRPHIDLLMLKEDSDKANRVKSDYRETLGNLLLTEFNRPWTHWANSKGSKSKLQAHGSPGNLIDLYASADIPECETFGSMPFDIPALRRDQEDIREGDADAVMLKFSSSAAHISGKPLTSSETFTWLRDHFKTALSQCKPEAEDLLLNGINHIFLHGSTYSPERAEWPGWKFYASVNFNPNNTIWEDAPSLFAYITNSQRMLQAGKPDNEVLLYWPIYDVWDDYLESALFFQFKIHSLNEWLLATPFYTTAKKLMKTGYGVDFISDTFIKETKFIDGKLVVPGGTYKSMVVPDSDKMPLATFEKLVQLKKEGAQIIFEGLPESVPGLYKYEEQNASLQNLIKANGEIIVPETNSVDALKALKLLPESLVDTGLKFIRRDVDGDKIYYVVNHTANAIDEYIPLQTKSEGVLIYDPLTNKQGMAVIKNSGPTTLVKVQIPSGKSLILTTGKALNLPKWPYYEDLGSSMRIAGSWKLSFLKGGPNLPAAQTISQLQSWTDFGQKGEYFSGTARYEISFDKPKFDADGWRLNLGDVRESAKVWLNDKFIGDAWSVPFTLEINELQETNNLVIQVTNLPANRIRAKELQGEEWKIFHEINMVDKDYKKFDATKWDPMPSGLLSEVTLTPLKHINN